MATNICIYLNNIKNERQEWKFLHKLIKGIFVVSVGILANADDWQEMKIFCKTDKDCIKFDFCFVYALGTRSRALSGPNKNFT